MFPVLTSFYALPRVSSFTTVTRGPMVRKKQSREQVGFSQQKSLVSFKLPCGYHISFTDSVAALAALLGRY